MKSPGGKKASRAPWPPPERKYEPPQPLPDDRPTPADKYDGYLELLSGEQELLPRPPAPEPEPVVEPIDWAAVEREAQHAAMKAAIAAAKKGSR